jgi:hypothetical protein
MALTDTALRALKPNEKPYIVSDDRGLYVEVFPTGGIVWRFDRSKCPAPCSGRNTDRAESVLARF